MTYRGLAKMFHTSKDHESEGTTTFCCCFGIVLSMIIFSLGFLINSQQALKTSPSTDDGPFPSTAPSSAPANDGAPTSTSSTPSPTILRSQPPTSSPTITPTILPSQPPISFPTITTMSPTSRESAVTSLLEGVTPASILGDTSGAQYRALQWVTYEDPLQVPVDESRRLVQRYIITTIYFATDGEGWRLCGGNDNDSACEGEGYVPFLSGVSECGWYGIRCRENSEDVVESIDLEQNRLRGTIPSEIASLSDLDHINLSANDISGGLPQFPPSISTILLNNNELSGNIPSNINSLSKLTALAIGNNKLSGPLPHDMFPPSLAHLDLEGNSFNASIPEEIFDCGYLRTVDLNTNQFTGTINPKWGTLENLSLLNLQTNNFTGSLPGAVFTPSMTALSVALNNLVGTIPDEVFGSVLLEYLDLGRNHFNGTLPKRFGELKNMKQLTIWLNNFTGTIPSEIGSLPVLEMFQVPYNYLTGEMPEEICKHVPNPLAALGADCKSPEPAEQIPPRVNCTCCTSCQVGYG